MIVVVLGVFAAICGFGLGILLGFWKSIILAGIVSIVLINVALGILIVEFPIALVVGGIMAKKK